jgi:hypothetical protein
MGLAQAAAAVAWLVGPRAGRGRDTAQTWRFVGNLFRIGRDR